MDELAVFSDWSLIRTPRYAHPPRIRMGNDPAVTSPRKRLGNDSAVTPSPKKGLGGRRLPRGYF